MEYDGIGKIQTRLKLCPPHSDNGFSYLCKSDFCIFLPWSIRPRPNLLKHSALKKCSCEGARHFEIRGPGDNDLWSHQPPSAACNDSYCGNLQNIAAAQELRTLTCTQLLSIEVWIGDGAGTNNYAGICGNCLRVLVL